ncbi:hypothetical protein B0H67DRAFT_552974 [Lasiosphaeris hirsuta]|uniref:Uncharacterized protein n=1 Tax=Lasiosphaeris hirsuta TaxID=260670 RepID=A0AA40ARX3_9PEZI|nr:hypothetical protein B0H67DRAFT_552974 [Lasiosphaeris hirsuta]
MFAQLILPALAVIGTVSAQTGTCTVTTTTINSQADATGLASCRTVKGSVLIAPGAGPSIDISGPSQITGDLRVENNGVIESLISNDLTILGGAFIMKNVTRLSSLDMPSLNKVKSIAWQSLNALDSLSIGPPGITQAEDVIISDTFLSTLNGIDLTSVRLLDINNNRRLTVFTTQLGNLSDNLNIQANGLKLEVTMPNLIWIANMTIANVTKFSVPSLAVVNGSARFDSNYFATFAAPNLTTTKAGDISFVGNANLKNISLPLISTIGGGLLIANNTALSEVDGFPKLKTVGGAVKLRGNFTNAEFPSLNDVKGAFDVSSTADISASCDGFKKLAPTKDGGAGQIQGTYACTSNNENANQDTGTGTSTGGGSGSTGGKKDNSAAGVTFNTALVGLAAFAALAAAFW